jgi:hypothetical protein
MQINYTLTPGQLQIKPVSAKNRTEIIILCKYLNIPFHPTKQHVYVSIKYKLLIHLYKSI